MAGWYVGGFEMQRSWSDSSLLTDRDLDYRRYPEARKRRLSDPEYFDLQDDYELLPEWKRLRLDSPFDEYESGHFNHNLIPPFFVIKEAGRSPLESDSGLSGDGHTPFEEPSSVWPPDYAETSTRPELPFLFLKVRGQDDTPDTNHTSQTEDEYHDAAARLVERYLMGNRQRRRLAQHERILRSLICPKSHGAEFDIDDDALQGIFFAVNEIFFRGRLKGRVTWAWEDLPSNLIGTTALRNAPDEKGGLETLIFLSKQILKDKKYNRRLLISTFIHELIHSYLFIQCGFHPSDCGGHTKGFERIAELIDGWAGHDLLHLCNMEAELSNFEVGKPREILPPDHMFSGCQVQWLDDGSPAYIVIMERPRPVAIRLPHRDLPWE
ncbi:Uu.00g028770.m01.CDS01 [Anthostomella pinea]|uniref:Uu.00g028770.m01.CDS01 n=1 Tax=Anthostomella pinea TaxID=933095 RepID=A0AAI8YAF0_9PEZI|nr:Uu.00g028770.m01.CDS01 [Anthostomella pinea]